MSPQPQFQETVELLRLAQHGRRDALHLLLERYRETVLRRIRLMMGEQARIAGESGDFLQETLLQVVSDLAEFEPQDERSFLRWVTRIARNRIASATRRQRERSLADFVAAADLFGAVNGDSPSSEAARNERVERLVELLEALDDDHRTVIELRNFEGLSFRAIGERMQRSENAVQLLHTRALIALGRSAGPEA